MNTLEKILGLLVVVLIVALFMVVRGGQSLGNLFTEQHAYSSAVTYTSTTLTGSTATSLVPRAANSRTYAKICAKGGPGIIWLFKQATSTGVQINLGSPIFATTTGNFPQFDACMTMDANDPYTGEIWGITEFTSSITAEYLQN